MPPEIGEITINQWDPRQRDKFINPHSIITSIGGGRDLIVLTGVIIVDLQGRSETQWNWVDLMFSLSLPIPSGKAFLIEQGAPLVTLSHIANKGTSNNAGNSVEWFHFMGATTGMPHTDVKIRARLGVGDVDGFLRRVGYHITLIAREIEFAGGGFG